jgi:hypothetical protein
MVWVNWTRYLKQKMSETAGLSALNITELNNAAANSIGRPISAQIAVGMLRERP